MVIVGLAESNGQQSSCL